MSREQRQSQPTSQTSGSWPAIVRRARTEGWELARVLSWAVWWGGLTFYAAVVVPQGTDVVGAVTQGFITQRTTLWLNGLCGVMLVVWWPPWRRGRGRGRWILWGSMAASLLVLFVLHRALTSRLDFATETVARTDGFYAWHAAYLWVITWQWLCGLAMAIDLQRDRATESAI